MGIARTVNAARTSAQFYAPGPIVEATILGDQAFGEAQMAPLRALGAAIDTFAMVPPVGIAELHMDPPTPLPYASGGHVLASRLTAEVIEDFVAATGPGSGSALISAEIRHTGGELHRAQAGNGALATLPGEYMTFGVGLVVDETSARAVRGTLAMMEELFEPVDTGRRYLNFVEEPTDPARFYDPEAYVRLRHVKAVFDPYRIIRANHPIRPAVAATC